jgi:iron(III) transport system permease protein
MAGADRARRRPRLGAWPLAGIVTAVAIVSPLLVLPTGFLDGGLDPLARVLLPRAFTTSLVLALGVGAGALLIGGGLAVLVSFWDFPGRRWMDAALVLPLALPSYVLVYVVLGQYGLATPLESNLFGDGLQLPGIRSTTGAIVILTAVLYPYVYLLGRSAFLGQSRRALEAARSLGRSYTGAVWRVAVPMARPALAAGSALAAMEALADFGTVDLLGVQALTNAIFRVWTGTFNQDAALQLATILVGLTLSILVLERVFRGRARYDQVVGAGDAVVPKRLRGVRGWLATATCCALLLAVFALPVAQLVAWSVESVVDGTVDPGLRDALVTTILLGGVATLAAVTTGLVVVYGLRRRATRAGRVTSRLATLGYGVPGTVVAVAVFVPLVWLDRRLIDAADALGGGLGLLFTGSILGLVLAYLVRFHSLSQMSIDSSMERINPNLDDAARSLGADATRLLADVHVPLLRPGIATAALLVLVEVMKELPATALLRPLGHDTLAITVWEATKDTRVAPAALPALLIVVVSLVPVVVLTIVRRGHRAGPAVTP